MAKKKLNRVYHKNYSALYVGSAVRYMLDDRMIAKSKVPSATLDLLQQKLKTLKPKKAKPQTASDKPKHEKDDKGKFKAGVKGVGQETNKNGTAGATALLDDAKVRADFLVAAALGANIEACCAYAKIHKSTYYKYVTEHPEFSDEVDQKSQQPYLTAIQSVVAAMKDDPKLALKFLERKHKDEFSLRKELTGADGKDIFDGMSDDELEQFITSTEEH
jgi:hypothetical protein